MNSSKFSILFFLSVNAFLLSLPSYAELQKAGEAQTTKNPTQTSSPELLQKMQSYSQDDFLISAKRPKKSVYKEIQNAYELLGEAASSALNSKQAPPSDFFKAFVQLISYTYDVDKSFVVHDHASGLLKKYPTEMNSAIETLPIEKRNTFRQTVKNRETEKRRGNG